MTTAMEPVESTIDRDLLTEFTRTIPGQLFEARASRTKYEYDNETTRVEKVSRNALTEYGVEYTYRSDAHLIDHYQYMDSAGWLAKVTFAYESDLDLISQVENRVVDPPENDGVVSKYDYYYDDLGRLETVARSQGFYFGDGPTYHEDITYNDRNMLLTVRRFNSATPNSGTALPDYNQTFSYNTYGDRITEWYGDGDDDPNLAIAFNALDLPIYAREPGDPNDPNYAVKSFTYDDDQNMTEDDGMIYRYDAENRLIEVEPDLDPNCIDPESDYLSVYTYDYLSRVVRERRFEWDAIEEEWETGPALDHRFMYYKKMKLLTLGLVNGEIERLFKFAYGPGTDGRLGGPGSLLATRDVTAEKNFICFNNGAGKLVDLVDRADPNNVYENYEMTGNRGAFEGPCWSPDWLTDCDACGECFSGWWVDTRIPQPGAPGYCMDVTLPVCHCGPSGNNPGSQRRRKGPDEPCVVPGSPEGCGGCGGGTSPPGWVVFMCAPVPEDEKWPTYPCRDGQGCTREPKDPCGKNKALRDKGVQKLIDKLKSTPGCKKPNIVCNPNSPDCKRTGWPLVWNPKTNTITMCKRRPASALRHELIHALQQCDPTNVLPEYLNEHGIERIMCREIQAVMCSGEKCKSGNTGKDCAMEKCEDRASGLCTKSPQIPGCNKTPATICDDAWGAGCDNCHGVND